MRWDATLYQKQHGFVAAYGQALLDDFPQGEALDVLDIGCGTGELTARIAALGHRVLGIDSSAEMVAKARAQYPALAFERVDALALPFEARFDVVFSNAVFHWILRQDLLLDGIHRALRPGGALICEFGAEGNVAQLRAAFAEALKRRGLTAPNPFFLPSPEEYQKTLAAHGLVPLRVNAFDRPTPLSGGEEGLAHWVRQFFAADLARLNAPAQAEVIREMEVALRPALWDGTQWIADYRRLRVLAEKGR